MAMGKLYKARAGKQSAKQVATKALKLARKANQKIEIQKRDVTANGTITTAGQVIDLHSISTFNTMDGSYVKGVSTAMNLRLNTEAGQIAVVRVMILRDKVGNDVAPTLAQIMTNNSNPYLGHIEPSNTKRFPVILDRLYKLTNGDDVMQLVKFGKRYNYLIGGDKDADSNFQQNKLWLVLISDIVSTNPPSYVFHSRLRYTDA